MIYWSFRIFQIGIIAIFGLAISCAGINQHFKDNDRIQPYFKNPFYWQYKGEPILLLGGSGQDNLFNHPTGPVVVFPPDGTLESHLDLLVSVGGNYVRNTMSHRDQGHPGWARMADGRNVYPFIRLDNGKFDLDQPNPEYWQRFENFLRMTDERDIIVQIEIWDIHDFFRDDWPKMNPWNPQNNITYSENNTRLLKDYGGSMLTILPDSIKHDFFFSVPNLNNDSILLNYQQRFVDKLLSHSLKYSHVLYCISNEMHPHFSEEWGLYWARYLHEKARKAGKSIEVTEMYWTPTLDDDQHRPSLIEHPDLFTYFEASQNSGRWQNGLKYARLVMANKPRPINNVKLYGSEVDRFWMNIFGGSASSRFHRPPHGEFEGRHGGGQGLNSIAQAQIKSARLLFEHFNIFESTTDWDHNLFIDRGEYQALLLYHPGKQYALYFPHGCTVKLDLSEASGKWKLRWLDIDESRWVQEQTLHGGGHVDITTPDEGHWVAVILPVI